MERDERGALTGRTERLHLRPWEASEAQTLLEIRQLPEVSEWLGDPIPWTTVDQATDFISSKLELCSDDTPLGTWAIVPDTTGIPVGTVSLVELPGDTEVQIGWHLHPDSNGNGYASEAAAAVLAHGLASGIGRIWAIMWAHNEPSAGVAKRIGMTDLGVRIDQWYGTDEDPHSLMFITPHQENL